MVKFRLRPNGLHIMLDKVDGYGYNVSCFFRFKDVVWVRVEFGFKFWIRVEIRIRLTISFNFYLNTYQDR
jgi:hypothetical protein